MDPARPIGRSVSVMSGRILAVDGPAPAGARLIDGLGGVLVPGFVDPHVHLLAAAAAICSVDCSPRSVRSIVEMQSMLGAAAAAGRAAGTGWLRATGYDESRLAEGRHPTRHDLDAVAPEHPVVLHRVWNKLVCNTAALREAGVTRESPEPPAGERYAGSFERDDGGEPTGLFRDRAKALITNHVPPPTEDEMVAGIGAG